jgi:NAD(P)-dependent dehydrogenase (short-subunit alcohol dehydrogenase family)
MREIAPERYDGLRRAVPLQRWAEPSEVATVIEFLAGRADDRSRQCPSPNS